MAKDKTKDMGSELINNAREILKDTDELAVNFSNAEKNVIDMSNALAKVLENSKELVESYGSVDKLLDGVKKDFFTLRKVEKEIAKISKDEINKNKEHYLKMIDEEVKNIKDISKQEELRQKLLESLNEDEKEIEQIFKHQLELLEAQRKQYILSTITIGNIKNKLDEIGGALRNPSQAFDGLVGKAGEMPGKILESVKGAGSLGGALKGAAANGMSKIITGAKYLLSLTGLIMAAIMAVVGVIYLVYKAFQATYEFVDKKVLPAHAAINKELGNTGIAISQLKRQAVSTGVQFEMLGLRFEQGAEAVTKLASAMMTTEFSSKTLKTGLMLSEYVGLGAEQAGKLMLAFQKGEGSVQNLDKTMFESYKLQKEYGVPVQQIRKDFGENIDVLQRFGTANSMQFSKSIAVARSYGLSIKEVNAAFGKQLDTFEGSSMAAAKLNSMFGTTINSYELMLETDPTKRMVMMRKELEKQGKSWDKMNVFEKNIITSTMGITEEQAALVLSSEKVRKKLEWERKEKEKRNKIDNDWNKGLSNIKQTLLALQPKIDLLLRTIADFVSELLGFGSAEKVVGDSAKVYGKFFDDITGYIKKLKEDIYAFQMTWDMLFNPSDTLSGTAMMEQIEKATGYAKKIDDLTKKIPLDKIKKMQDVLNDSSDETRRVLLSSLYKQYDVETVDKILKQIQVGSDIAMKNAAEFAGGAGVPYWQQAKEGVPTALAAPLAPEQYNEKAQQKALEKLFGKGTQKVEKNSGPMFKKQQTQGPSTVVHNVYVGGKLINRTVTQTGAGSGG